MKKIFQSYANYYDIIYADKDYEKECDFLEDIFKGYSKSIPKTIIDGGCGTGGHAIPLAKRGYDVTGVDLSEEMINIAKEKAEKSKVKIGFKVMDLRELRLDKKYDAYVCMFAVVSYLTKNSDLEKALTVRKYLKDDSLFIFDFWYGPAVLKILPSTRMKTVEKGDVKVIRFAEPAMDTTHNLCKVKYYFIAIKKNKVIFEGNEEHTVRYYFPDEIESYLDKNGFKLLRICPFLDLNSEPSEETWNVTAIAKAV